MCGWARLGLGENLESLSIPIQGFREVLDADLVLCIEAFLLESVDMAGELYQMIIEVEMLVYATLCLAVVN